MDDCDGVVDIPYSGVDIPGCGVDVAGCEIEPEIGVPIMMVAGLVAPATGLLGKTVMVVVVDP